MVAEKTERRDLMLIGRARKALAEAKTLGEVKAVRDQGHAAIQWQRSRRDIGLEARNEAAEIVCDAERRMGVMLAEMEKAGQRDAGKGGNRKSQFHDGTVIPPTLSDLGISKQLSHRCQLAKVVPEKKYREWVAEKREAKKEITSGELQRMGGNLRRKTETRAREDAAVAKAPKDKGWTVTQQQDVVQCHALITDPPYGILDQGWEPAELETFTRKWAERWSACGADFAAVFWSQRYLWDGRRWFDESLAGYQFQQLLVWVCPNNKSPQSRRGFKQTWEPIFFYRRADSEKEVRIADATWGESFTDFDHHIAAVPQENFNDENMKQHPAQKPVSVMLWLVNALTEIGELVCDPFCGSGTTGIAAGKLGRRFHGIDSDQESVELARRRIAAYGVRTATDR